VRGGVAVFALAAALLTAGCGTGGISKAGDADKGKKLFLAKCGGCHTLAAAGTHGNQGPNLDDAFAHDRQQGFKQVTIQQVVRDQIELASCVAASHCMPANLVKGSDADAVAAYVAMVAANPSSAGPAKNATSGKDIFLANCGSCHTLADAGTTGAVGPNLDDLKPDAATVQHQVEVGGGPMPAFKGTLSDAEIANVAAYVASVAGK
jgi:cbb3-type cytochrome c oxidase subunit III